MEPFGTLESIAAPMPRANVDTDLIWPTSAKGSMRRGKQARVAFATLRFDEDGAERPDFLLNQQPYREARILVAGPNFGCGSSREMAVWALYEWGLRCVIAPSFGDIFYNNACLNGLLPVRLPADVVDGILQDVSDPGHRPLVVDLASQTVSTSDGTVHHFEISSYHRHLMLEGLDEIGYTLRRIDTIEAFEDAYLAASPWVWTDAALVTGPR
jgi:3-isopropylmalate/(R)-2-methylmalate dehydratase small subunit